ncbi:hypothetical protein [Streptomyces sp. NPDC001068]|uniref:hypothetical protein n=1 Tax=Streptomyces sp. NPDC001068 TaxID=3364544 RepID=UPI0036ABB802
MSKSNFVSRKLKKKSSLCAAALAATLSILTISSATQASATGWSPEISGGQQVTGAAGFAQAHDNSNNIADVWNDTQGHIHVAFNNGTNQTWPTAVTHDAPAVVHTEWGWRAFHTGTDNHIYYAGFEVGSNNSLTLGSWQQVPGNVTTTSSPTVTPLPGANLEQWELAYTGLDNHVYAQYHQRTSQSTGQGTFATPQAVTQAVSNYAPALATDTAHGSLTVAWTGTNGSLYASQQRIGTSTWSSALTMSTPSRPILSQPTAAFTQDGQPWFGMNISDITFPDQSNPPVTYYAGPAQIDGAGTLIGHTHVAVEELAGLTSNPVLDPRNFDVYGIGGTENGSVVWKKFN